MEKTEFEFGVVYLGDCLEILPQLDEKSAEICVTSPPYNIAKDKVFPTNTEIGVAAAEQFKNWYFDELDELEYRANQIQVINELRRVCMSSIFYNHKIRYAWASRNKYRVPSNIYHPLDWLRDFPIWCEIIWDRCGISRPTKRYHVSDERVYQIGKPRKWNNELSLTNIWRIPPTKNKGHVCSFPPKLVANCLTPTTEEGDVVIDPFLGSGTTAVQAIKQKRRFIGIEKDPMYYELACKNISKALEQPSLF